MLGEYREPVFCEVWDSHMFVYSSSLKDQIVWETDINESIEVKLLDSLCFAVTVNDIEKRFKCKSLPECKRWVETLKALSVPRIILSMDDFEILSVIGRGFLGKVQLCKRKKTGELYAIKSVHKARLLNTGNPRSIVAERNILMMAQNPFIVQLHFAFQTRQKFYLGMEYAPGGDLFHYLEHFGNVPDQDARLYTAEIAIALHHLHEMDVLYRDLKPENIMFDAEGHIKLTDFGLAAVVTDAEFKPELYCGTLQYFSPEIIKAKSYSPASDWWGLGCVLFEMLTGLVAFEGETQRELIRKIIENKPILPIGIDEDAVDLIMGLLEKDPSQRYGWEAIRRHPYLTELDWTMVEERRYKPSFIPEVPRSEAVNNFDSGFTKEAAVDSVCNSEEMNIPGFSFSEFPVMSDGSYGGDMSQIDTQALSVLAENWKP